MTEWACPKCGMNETGDHTPERTASDCIASLSDDGAHCAGFICLCLECDDANCACKNNKSNDHDAPDHGESAATACQHASCYHCGWGGIWPAPPADAAEWEHTALEAGWTPPAGWGY